MLLGAGRDQGIAIGDRGRLLQADTVRGHFEVVDVYPEGSRATLIGSVNGAVSAATRAEIERPSGE